jgi:aminoglycoside 6-adenylyltransferase
MLANCLPPAEADMLARGVRVSLDKDDLLGELADVGIAPPASDLPDEAAFSKVVNDLWYHTVRTARKLRRGELWWAKSCCDSYLKDILPCMLEWHAQASSDRDVDTWMLGRFLEEWADPRAVPALPKVLARYDQENVWRALSGTMDLFRWLAIETVELLGYPYPEEGAENAVELVQKLQRGIWPEKSVSQTNRHAESGP